MQITNNRDINQFASNVADSGVKSFFKWFGILVNVVIKAVISLIKTALGK